VFVGREVVEEIGGVPLIS